MAETCRPADHEVADQLAKLSTTADGYDDPWHGLPFYVIGVLSALLDAAADTESEDRRARLIRKARAVTQAYDHWRRDHIRSIGADCG